MIRSMIVLTGLIASAALAASTLKLGDTKIVSDWEMACDNIKNCQATSLVPTDADYENSALLFLERPAGPGGVAKLTLTSNDDGPLGESYLTVDDGPRLATTSPKDSMGDWEIPLNADSLARLRKGNALVIRDPGGKVRARASLKGLTATMLYFDEKQGRVGTITALASPGQKPLISVPKAPVAPVIKRAPLSKKAPFAPSKAQWTKIIDQTGCGEEQDPDSSLKPDTHRLDANTTLLTIPCGAGAYNYSSAIMIAREGKGKAPVFLPAPMDYEGGWGEETDVPMLVNYGFEPDGTLSSYAKGRGIGDCGTSQQWVWDGTRFRLTNAMSLGSCQGSLNYLRLWTANVR